MLVRFQPFFRVFFHLRASDPQVKTDVIKGSLQPKFLKDCRLAVPVPESDTLRVMPSELRSVASQWETLP